MRRFLGLTLVLAMLLGIPACSGQATREGTVDVESPQEYQRKDRHVYKPQAAKTKPAEP